MPEFRVTMKPDHDIVAAVATTPEWHQFGLRCYTRAGLLAPGRMKTKLFVRFISGLDARIEIGSAYAVGREHLALLALLEMGTERHYIPRGAPDNPQGGPLVFYWPKVGRTVVFSWVNHPGTKPNRFVERAMQQILHEAMGISLVPL